MNAQAPLTYGGHGDRWSFSRLLDAPHRLAFAAATLMLVLSSLWWAAVNLSFSDGVALHWSLLPSLAHSLLMSFGFMYLALYALKLLRRPRTDRAPAGAIPAAAEG